MAINEYMSPFSGDRQEEILVRLSEERPANDDIRRWLSMLQAGEWYKVANELAPVSSNERGMETLRKHWADEFAGNALDALVSRLKLAQANFLENEKSSQCAENGLYSNSFDVFQSSGMGKSRLVSELGKKMMTISFVLRYPGQTGFHLAIRKCLSFC